MQRNSSAGSIRGGDYGIYSEISRVSDQSMDGRSLTLSRVNDIDGRYSILRMNRDDEKRDLATLNNKFAQYIERLKLLELRNRRLLNIKQSVLGAIEVSNNKLGEIYKSETLSLDKSRDVTVQALTVRRSGADDANERKESSLVIYSDAKKTHDETRVVLRKYGSDLLQKKHEIAILQRRLADINEEICRYGTQKSDLSQRIEALRVREEEEQLRINVAQQNKESLDSEINLLNQTHECEVDEYIQAIFDAWKNEKIHLGNNDLSQAISNARKEYEISVDSTRLQLMKKYEQMLSRRKGAAPIQDQSLIQSIDRVKKAKRSLQGEIDNCKATLCFLRTKQDDLIRAIAEENSENEKSTRNYQNTKLELEQRIQQAEETLKDSINSQANARKEIEEYRSLLEGDDKILGLRSIINSFAS